MAVLRVATHYKCDVPECEEVATIHDDSTELPHGWITINPAVTDAWGNWILQHVCPIHGNSPFREIIAIAQPRHDNPLVPQKPTLIETR